MKNDLYLRKLRADIKREHDNGLTNKEIAEKIGIPQPKVHYHMQQLGLKNNYWNKIKVFDTETFLKLYNEGKDDKEIANIMGYTVPNINYQRVKLELKRNYKRRYIK